MHKNFHNIIIATTLIWAPLAIASPPQSSQWAVEIDPAVEHGYGDSVTQALREALFINLVGLYRVSHAQHRRLPIFADLKADAIRVDLVDGQREGLVEFRIGEGYGGFARFRVYSSQDDDQPDFVVRLTAHRDGFAASTVLRVVRFGRTLAQVDEIAAGRYRIGTRRIALGFSDPALRQGQCPANTSEDLLIAATNELLILNDDQQRVRDRQDLGRRVLALYCFELGLMLGADPKDVFTLLPEALAETGEPDRVSVSEAVKQFGSLPARELLDAYSPHLPAWEVLRARARGQVFLRDIPALALDDQQDGLAGFPHARGSSRLIAVATTYSSRDFRRGRRFTLEPYLGTERSGNGPWLRLEDKYRSIYRVMVGVLQAVHEDRLRDADIAIIHRMADNAEATLIASLLDAVIAPPTN